MTSKARILAPWLLLLAAAGCATRVPNPQPTITQPARTTQVAPTPARPRPSPTPHRRPRPATPAPAPATSAPTPTQTKTAYSALPSMITADRASWSEQGRSMVVMRGNGGSEKIVPLFRQAIVLGQVRSAVAGSEAVPSAVFSHGTLTLDFSHGSTEAVATAVNKALSIPEVGNVQVLLPR